ncbi:hypothetical protein JTB14_012713 [Gonioctena quinquepunctata]|nr:hypothetical protein JTB14_012713 [Gonioctena quinquepunctata]
MDSFTFTPEEMSSYLVLTHSFYTNQQKKAYKSLTGYKYFEAGFVHDCEAQSIGKHIVVVAKVSYILYLNFKVKYSQRLDNPPLQFWNICEDVSTGEIPECRLSEQFFACGIFNA